MSLPVRVGTLLVAFLAVVGGAIFVIIHFFLAGPPVITAAGSASQVNLVLQEDPQNTVTSKPDWVSYFIQDPSSKKWVHTTLFKVPAGATVNVTVFGYDGCTPLRNPFWGRVTGTVGGTETIDGQTVRAVDSWRTCSQSLASASMCRWARRRRCSRTTTCALTRRAPRVPRPR
jgi:hypothetical protein